MLSFDEIEWSVGYLTLKEILRGEQEQEEEDEVIYLQKCICLFKCQLILQLVYLPKYLK